MTDTFVSVGEAASAVVADLARRTGRSVVETHAITSRDQWMALRRQDVTASTAGALLGVHPYATAYGLWADKSGLLPSDGAENAAMRRGRLLEPVAVQLIREALPDATVRLPGVYLRDAAARVGATPDLYVEHPERGLGVVQIKTAAASVYRRDWRDPDTGEVTPPLWVAVQAIVEARLAGAHWAAAAVLVSDYGLDFALVDVPIHAGIWDRLVGEVAEFWRRVERGEAPDPDYARDGALIARLLGQDDGSEVVLTSNRLPELLEERERLVATAKDAEAKRVEIDAEIRMALGTATVGRLPGWKITARTVNRKPYTVAASTSRPLRVFRTGVPQ